MTREEKEAFRRELLKDAKDIRAAFEGKYADELNALYGLSKADIDALVPGTEDLEAYARLIAVVERASQRNASQAELKEQIIAMGDLAVRVAKMAKMLV